MISIKKIEDGKILREVFTDTVDLIADGWNLHPSVNRFMTVDGSLQLSHGSSPAYLLRELPDKAVLEMENTYNPSTALDMGGFIAYVTQSESLQLYEYYNVDVGTALSYPFVRLVKNGNQYEGYGSQDGQNWDIRGAIDFDGASKWGVGLEGITGDVMQIHNLTIYKEPNISFKALPSGSKVEVFDENGTLVGDATESGYEATVTVFAKVIPFNGHIKVTDSDGVLVSEVSEQIYGGDVYTCGQFLDVLYEGTPLSLLDNDFGYIDSFYKDFRLELKNLIPTPHTNVNVEIKKFYEEFGWEWVEICSDDNGVPSGNFNKVITFADIPADGSVFFWVRITRNSVPVLVDDYIFDFVINVW